MNIPVLSAAELKQLLAMDEVIAGVETVYRLKAQGETDVWPHVCHRFTGEHEGVMDIKSGAIGGTVRLHGAKLLNTFWGNAARNLPTFTGLLMLFDATTGLPLGIMDASYITCMRTGASGALGIKAFARADASRLFVMGAGKQAVFQIATTLTLLPRFTTVVIGDPRSDEQAERFAASLPHRLASEFNVQGLDGVAFRAARQETMADLVRGSDAIITITPATQPLIPDEWVAPGTHLSCVGADMPGKEEVDPALFKRARVFADDLEQCSRIGEMELPLAQGVISRDDVVSEIGDVLQGTIPGRVDSNDVTLFDATGLALLDLITAKQAVDRAAAARLGQQVEI